MAANNKGTLAYSNSLAGRSKEDIICEFAYSLVTAGKDTPKSDTRKTVLDLWKKDDYSNDRLSEKQLRKFKIRGLLTDDTLDRIASVLNAATKDTDLMGGIITRVFMDFSSHLESMSGGYDDEVISVSEERLQKLLGTRSKINWSKVRADWCPAIAYIRTFSDLKNHLTALENRNISVNGVYKDFLCTVFGNDGMLWFVDRSGVKEDRQKISQYTNTSDFYKLCIGTMHDRMTDLQNGFLFAAASSEFGAYRGYALAGLSADTEAMRDTYDTIMTDEKGISLLNAKPDERAIKPPEEAYLDFWSAQESLRIAYEYARTGIDAMAVMRAADLTRKDMADIVKEAFLFHETWNDDIPVYRSMRDKEAVTKLIVRLWSERCFEKRLSSLYMQKKDSTKGEDSKYKAMTTELRKENESLMRKVAKLEKNLDAESRNAQDRNKAYLAEKASARDDLKAKEKLLSEKDAEIEELKMLLCMEETGEAEGVITDPDFGEEEFRDYTRSHKVLVWGLREETEKKYMSIFPELSFANSDRKLTRQQLEAYDALIMATNYTNHGNFWSARDTAKAKGIPMAYLDKTANTPEKFYEALAIALGKKRK